MDVLGAANLSVSTDRLDQAVTALETRILALKARADNGGVPVPSDYQSLVEEIEMIRNRERELEAAALGAFEAMGVAAANIRMLLAAEAS